MWFVWGFSNCLKSLKKCSRAFIEKDSHKCTCTVQTLVVYWLTIPSSLYSRQSWDLRRRQDSLKAVQKVNGWARSSHGNHIWCVVLLGHIWGPGAAGTAIAKCLDYVIPMHYTFWGVENGHQKKWFDIVQHRHWCLMKEIDTSKVQTIHKWLLGTTPYSQLLS